MKLIPYQVGENDIVVAENPKQAIKLLEAYSGQEGFELVDVEDLSGKVEMKIKDEEGKVISTLDEMIQECSEPQYLFGWE